MPDLSTLARAAIEAGFPITSIPAQPRPDVYPIHVRPGIAGKVRDARKPSWHESE